MFIIWLVEEHVIVTLKAVGKIIVIVKLYLWTTNPWKKSMFIFIHIYDEYSLFFKS
jgi:hypothetical protein